MLKETMFLCEGKGMWEGSNVKGRPLFRYHGDRWTRHCNFVFWRLLLFVIWCPSSETFSDDKRCLNVLSEESCDVVTIATGGILYFLRLHLPSSRSSISKHHSNAGKFVILLCLLLSGGHSPLSRSKWGSFSRF